MPSLQEERENLANADQHIADCEWRVAEEIHRIEEMDRRGIDTQDARETLQLLEDALAEWRLHRQLILDEIARLTVPQSVLSAKPSAKDPSRPVSPG